VRFSAFVSSGKIPRFKLRQTFVRASGRALLYSSLTVIIAGILLQGQNKERALLGADMRAIINYSEKIYSINTICRFNKGSL